MADNEDDLSADVLAAFKEVSERDDGAGDVADIQAPATREAATDDTTREAARETPSQGEERAERKTRAPEKDERGRFKKAGDAVEAREDTADSSVDGDKDAAAEKATHSPAGPPSSWSVKSKAVWEQLPAEVRADIAKREGEVAQGFAALKDYKDLKPYADMARQQNTTISAALKNYVGIENLLKQDMAAGLQQIARNFGLSQQQAGQMFASIAHSLMGGAQPQPGRGQQGGQQAGGNPNDPLYGVLKPFLEPLQAELAHLKQTHSSRETADRNAAERSLARAIETFSTRAENRYFPELEETISRLFETGMVPLTGDHESDLRRAYDTAASLVPEVRDALIEQRMQQQRDAARQREQEAADRARNASRSLTGPRIPGTVTQTHRPASNGYDSIEDDVRAAFALHSQR